MKPLFRKTILLAAGILSALVLLEAGLRLNSFLYVLLRHSVVNSTSSTHPKIKILCVGDSFTFGMGAPKGAGYPDHLRRILDSRYGTGAYAVINAGIPGQNSSKLADSMDFLLDANKPDLLLVLIGGNYNLWGSNFFLFASEGVSFPRRLALKTHAFLSRFKTYKFLVLGTRMALSGAASAHTTIPCSSAANKSLADFRAEFSGRNFKKASTILEAALLKDEKCAELNFERGRMYFYYRDFPKAFLYFRKGRDLDPGHQYTTTYLTQEPALFHPEYAGRALDKMLQYDLELICKAAKRAGAIPLIQTYPFTKDSQRDWIRAEAAAQAGTPLINHRAVFQKLMPGGKFREYLSGDEPDLLDSHPNSRGYELMADNIYETLETLALFKPPATDTAPNL
jgi:lysophospholipase L1-like esterase